MGSTGLGADNHSAVFFIENNQVARQMRTSDFGAFLDGYVGLSDLAETDVKAVFVELDDDLHVRSLVFFRIWFDEEGRADSRWDLPLEELAVRGAKGPDMGGGAIRLVCRSLCPDPRYVSDLWDPDMTPGNNHFQVIREAVSANTLKFPSTQSDEDNIPVLRAGDAAPAPTEDVHYRALLEADVLARLKAQSVFLVAYHPGVGHLTLPYDDIATYFDNPVAYAAARCGVSEPEYLQWLEHYENPVCLHLCSGDEACSEPLPRVSQPGNFKPGQDNRCEAHRS
ncbi:hypothetical protein HLV39_12625 [Marinobacter adhaerens]|uniref:Uncharacterized protein n=1 Tax=Marinobacter adhaerens TaxID=1033846 RepID=A0A851HTI5_9GAMM|nr:hypothetical protein [Marinobacter adhaerens]NWN92337.1 hypothetical protein [Marinobacter adhaerens]